MSDDLYGEEELFEDVPIPSLRINVIDWQHAAEHIRRRSERYGRKELDIEPEWATEAALDPQRLISKGSGKSGESIEIIGHAPSAPRRINEDYAGRILKVWLVPKVHHPPGDEWWGASACEAKLRERKEYREGA